MWYVSLCNNALSKENLLHWIWGNLVENADPHLSGLPKVKQLVQALCTTALNE